MSLGVCLFLQGVIRKYGRKAHTSGLHRDINVPRIILHLEDSRSHKTEAEAKRGQRQGARPRALGARPLWESNQDSASWEISTDLKDESKPYNLCQFDPTAHIHLKGL